MKLTLRLTVTVTLMMALVLAMLAKLSIDREAALMADDIEHDVALVATILGRARVSEATLEALDHRLWDRKADRLHVQRVANPSGWRAQWDAAARARFAEGAVLTERRHHEGQEWVHALVRAGGTDPDPGRPPEQTPEATPTGTDSPPSGPAIEVTQSLASRDAFVRRTYWTNALAVLLTTAFGGLFTLLFGRRIVGQRVDALVAHARHLGGGAFDGAVAEAGSDELTELARALNQLGRDLTRVHARLADEAAAHLRAQRALEHADRLRVVGQLAAGVAHEVGTPLSVIGGRAQLIARRHAPDQRDHLDAAIIREQTQHISELIHRLLDFARVTPRHPQACDLRALVAETLELLAPEGRRGRLRVAAELPAAPVVAWVDPRALRQVLMNLVMNGLQAMEATPTARDGGLLTVSVAGPQPDPLTGAPSVLVRVRDEGPGVPEALQARLFEPFFTTKAPGEGTGLGLPVVARIVADHGGRVWLAPSAEGGACFCVLLPVDAPPAPAAPS